MKVPNRILEAVAKLIDYTEQPHAFAPPVGDEMQALKTWLKDGITRRAALSAKPKTAEAE